MTNEHLAALSDAATQGEWKSIFYDAGDRDYYDHNGPTPGIFCDEADCGIIHWDGFKQKHWSSANGNQRQIEANAALIVALVNAYRANQIALIGPDAVEKVARAIRAAHLSGQFPPFEVAVKQVASEGIGSSYKHKAEAAIAALTGRV